MLTPDVAALQGAVAGRYALERELGRGGMGLVLLARDLTLDRAVAIKVLPGALAAEPALRARFLREARISAGLSHPHVVPIHAVEEHRVAGGDVVFFAMAYVDGETLAERVRRTGPLPAGEVARVLREVAWALAYAHGRGIVHRDVKPENILIERGSGRALVSDFGIARSTAAPSTLTRDGEILGSVAFMSPEQAEGAPVDARSDLYALGGVGYYLLTGRPPFEAPTAAALLVRRLTLAAPPVTSVRADVPPRLAAAVDRCLARAPEARFPSAEAVAEALAAASGASAAADIAPPVRSFLRAAEQTMWLVWLIAVFTMVYGLPTVRRLAPLLVGIAFGAAIVSVDVLRRARELLGEGFGAGDVRRAFALERQAHDEELRALFDARRTASRRRTRRRAWTTLGVAAVVKAAMLTRALHAPAARPPGTPPNALWFAANVCTDLVLSISLVLAFSASPRAERRFFRLTARLWEGWFGRAVFRVVALGRRAPGTGGSALLAAPPRDALPPGVVARVPELPVVLRRLEVAYAALGTREAEVARAVAAAGISAAGFSDVDADDARADGSGPNPSTVALHARRDELVAEMRHALEAVRAQRTALAAARENIRVQLLRIGAGIGAPDELNRELATARALMDGAPAGAPGERPDVLTG